jgi:hypothetical protein
MGGTGHMYRGDVCCLPPDTYAQCHPYLLMLYLQMCPIYPSAITNVPNIQSARGGTEERVWIFGTFVIAEG